MSHMVKELAAVLFRCTVLEASAASSSLLSCLAYQNLKSVSCNPSCLAVDSHDTVNKHLSHKVRGYHSNTKWLSNTFFLNKRYSLGGTVDSGHGFGLDSQA